MENFVVLNGLHIGYGAGEALLPNGDSAVDLCIKKAVALKGVKAVYILIPSAQRSLVDASLDRSTCDVEILERKAWDVQALLDALLECSNRATCSDPAAFFYHIYLDAPFFDLDLTEAMTRDHLRYYAGYSFADAYPRFLAPELLSVAILDQVASLYRSRVEKGDAPILSDSILFDIIQKDINAFDIETAVSDKDYRLLRIDLAARGRGQSMLMQRLAREGATDAPSICRLIDEKPELLRTLPGYAYVQISEGCPQHCSYCPYPHFPDKRIDSSAFMSTKRFSLILDALEAFCGEICISPSLWGEVSRHPELETLIQDILSRRGFQMLIETSGIGWSMETLEAISRIEGARKRITWICSLDALEPNTYRSLRGDGFDEACAAAESLQELFPGKVYVQAVRQKENEAELESFYRHWKQRDLGVIIQKYDSFAGVLPDRSITDLSPLRRFPCWHLKRDLHIMMDGTVPLCREILPGTQWDTDEYRLGNIFEESIEEIWKRGLPFYLAHTEECYHGPCGTCDEYYTYNF